jgi:hypothetical protein
MTVKQILRKYLGGKASREGGRRETGEEEGEEVVDGEVNGVAG